VSATVSQTIVSSGAKALVGMSWMFAGSMLSRLVTLAGQVVLGWLLLADDFGAYAFAISVAGVVAAVRNGGTAQVIVQRGSEYAQHSGLFFKYSLAFNLVAMLALLAIGIPMWAGGSPAGLILCSMAIAIPLGTPSVLFKAKLTIDGRFQEVARIGLWSAVLWQASIVFFAWLGWGALSFVVPPLLQALYENVAGWSYVRQLPHFEQKQTWEKYLHLFRETRWLMLSAAMLAPATSGTYFMVAMLHDVATTGIYFFAFQLVVAFGTPIYGAVESVLPSIFVKMEPDRTRQVATYVRAIKAALLVGLPAAAIFSLVIPDVMHFLWQGKWDVAAPLVQVLAACVPAWIVVAIVRSLVEARGLWRLRFGIVSFYGLGGMAAAAIGAFTGAAQSVALYITAYYVCFAALLPLALAGKLGTSFLPGRVQVR
jgi:O-antigen/teichoic acid export membrane protein